MQSAPEMSNIQGTRKGTLCHSELSFLVKCHLQVKGRVDGRGDGKMLREGLVVSFRRKTKLVSQCHNLPKLKPPSANRIEPDFL